MIDSKKLEESLKPWTPTSLRNWILFTNHYHNSHRSEAETIAVFKEHDIGEYIDFDKLEKLLMPKPTTTEPASGSIKEPECQVVVRLNHQQAGELFRLLDECKDQHPELHELVYQAMTTELFSRINRG